MSVFTDQEKEDFRTKLIKKYYYQGDDYSVSKSKKGVWHFGYSNDYPLQHGSGQSFTLPDRMVEILMAQEL